MHKFVEVSFHELEYSDKNARKILKISYEKFKELYPRPFATNLIMMWNVDFEELLRKAQTNKIE